MKARRELVILGLGHIGASLAARLSAEGWKVWGWDSDPATLRFCRTQGWLYHVAREGFALEGSPLACVVALPEQAVHDRGVRQLLTHLPRGTLVTDVFSSKGEATAELARFCRQHGLRHAWSHPLAGREGHGARSADPTIFSGARAFIDSKAGVAERRALTTLWKSVGSQSELISTRAHQRRMASGSHLMHVLAYSLMHTLEDRSSLSPSVLGVTRVAKSNPTGWSGILVSNRAELGRAVRRLERELKTCARMIARGDVKNLEKYLARAQRARLDLEKNK